MPVIYYLVRKFQKKITFNRYEKIEKRHVIDKEVKEIEGVKKQLEYVINDDSAEGDLKDSFIPILENMIKT